MRLDEIDVVNPLVGCFSALRSHRSECDEYEIELHSDEPSLVAPNDLSSETNFSSDASK